LFFQIAHYCIRPWAWIIVALAAVILYPDIASGDEKLGYVYAMRDFLPSGWKGLLLVAFLAAYMSTISTQLNWGAGYLVNDVYKRFLQKDKEDSHYVMASRVSTVFLMVLGLIISTFINSISGAWGFIMQAGAGLGLVLILRWYWWRINVWSEIAATVTPFVVTPFMYFYSIEFEIALIITTLVTTGVWLMVTFATKPEPDALLKAFWKKVHGVEDGQYKLFSSGFSTNLKYLTACWVSAIVMTYSILFLTGKFILQEYSIAFTLTLVAIVSLYFLNLFMGKAGLIGETVSPLPFSDVPESDILDDNVNIEKLSDDSSIDDNNGNDENIS
jgi:solute:Na+ symporter, SSS family